MTVLLWWGYDASRSLTLASGAVQNGDDLVLMDVHMPVMDGLEAAKAIRALHRPLGSLPIVGLTACPKPAPKPCRPVWTRC